MKIAREIVAEILPTLDDEERIPALKEILNRIRTDCEAIIAAKLEPVKEALDILLSVEEYDTINYAFDSDSIKECRDALAMFDD